MKGPIIYEKDDYTGERGILKVAEFGVEDDTTTLVFVISLGRFTLEAKPEGTDQLYIFDVYDEGGTIVASGMVDGQTADALHLITELHRSVDVPKLGNVFVSAAIAAAQVIHNTY